MGHSVYVTDLLCAARSVHQVHEKALYPETMDSTRGDTICFRNRSSDCTDRPDYKPPRLPAGHSQLTVLGLPSIGLLDRSFHVENFQARFSRASPLAYALIIMKLA